MSCISVAAAFTTDLLGIAPKYKLQKSFALKIKVLSRLTTTLSKTFPRYESKAIKQYDLGSEQIFFSGLGRV